MNPDEFKNLYQGEFTATPLPAAGYERVFNRAEAERFAKDLGLSRRDWRYISRADDLHGIIIPNRQMFYFIFWEIATDRIQERVQK